MRSAVAALTVLFGCSATLADDGAEDAGYKAIVSLVTVPPRDPKSDDCTMNISADFSKYTDKVDVIWNAFLNKEYPLDFYKQRRRQVFAYVVLKRAAELITEGIYHNNEKKECSFTMTVDYTDKFGQDRKFEAVSWRFNAEQYAKVNWQKFDPRDFADIALDYRVKPAVTEWTSEEPSMNRDTKTAPESASDCDPLLFSANAMFIRATTFCKKDYMDSPEGLAALAGARKCSLDQKTMEQKAKAAMLTLDQIARQKGKAAVCPFVEQVAHEVRAKMN